VYYRGIEEARRIFTINSMDDLRRLLDAMWYHYPWYFKPFTRAILHDMAKRRVNEIVAAVEPSDLLTDEFTRLKLPVSIIWGKEDRLFAQETAYAMKKMLLHVHVHFLARCGHVPQLEKPEALIQVLNRS
jgi:pimeloyl-ACP methyl ester carboxylesterase